MTVVTDITTKSTNQSTMFTLSTGVQTVDRNNYDVS